MKKTLLILLLSGIFHTFLFAQNYQSTGRGLKTNIQSMDIEISFYSPDIVRVIKSPEGTIARKESFSVIKSPGEVKVELIKKANEVLLKSSSIHVSLNLESGKIQFISAEGKSLLIDKDYGTQFTPRRDGEHDSYTVRQSFLLDKDEPIYGLGQQQSGKMNQRGQRVELRQRNMYICIPFIQSVKGYGLFWDNYSPTVFQDNPQEMSFESTGTESNYYFINGGDADGVIAGMRNLTGQAPMFPLWTFGFWQSRERYASQDELLGVVKEYRKLGIPLDGIIQDWQYWSTDNRHWNSTEFGNPAFSDPQKMVEDVHKQNAHIIFSVWPSFGPESNIHKELKSKNMLFDFETYPPDFGVRVYDTFNPEARNIYWKYMNRNIFSIGADGWWLDATEPEHVAVKDSDFDQESYLGSLRSLYNAFPLVSVGGVYDHQREVSDKKRVFILTRSAFAGQQRYGANSWSGDVDARWDVLHNQIPAGLNFSICGIPYWNTDIGGFFVRDFEGGLKNKAYHELYVRWMQYGTFTPMMRSHGTNVFREIFQFGQRGDWAFDVQEKYINLRYRLLPYMYSTGWDVTKKSGSFLRALFMDFNHDKKIHDITDQYLFGRSLLVAPVTAPMYVTNSGEKSVADFSRTGKRKVYLPQGTKWYDLWTNELVEGGTTIEKETPIDIIPVYVKAGTILPLAQQTQFATEKKWNILDVYIYPGADGEFTLYEDENDNYNYEKGIFSEIVFSWNDKNKTLSVSGRKGDFPGMLKDRKFNIVVVKPGKNYIEEKMNPQYDKIISYKGKSIKVNF